MRYYTCATAFCVLLFGAVGSVGGVYRFTSTGNPLVKHISAADPDVHVWDRKVWVYCSMDANLRDHGLGPNDGWTYAHMDGYHVFSTTDMVNWTDHGEIMHSRDVEWGPPGWMWAPAAAWNGKRGRESKYFLYYPHKDWEGIWRIGVATGPSPMGPFIDSGAPIQGVAGIDPKIFIDDDGQAYLYYNSAMVVKLKENLMEIAESPRSINYGQDNIEESMRFEEGSYMHKADGIYYYSYSNWKAMNTTAYYATGKSPYGPFEWKGALAGKKSGSQDHHSIIRFKGLWYYFYHMDTPWEEKRRLGWEGQRRIACYEQMVYSSKSSISLITPKSLLVNSGGSHYTTKDGKLYQWDLWYSGSGVGNTMENILGTVDAELYQSYRFGGQFSYDIPLVNGRYRVTFRFAETYHTSVGRRVFNISMEGTTALQNLDVFSMVGKNKAYDVTRVATVRDNELNIVFSTVTDNAMISAMKIVPTAY